MNRSTGTARFLMEKVLLNSENRTVFTGTISQGIPQVTITTIREGIPQVVTPPFKFYPNNWGSYERKLEGEEATCVLETGPTTLKNGKFQNGIKRGGGYHFVSEKSGDYYHGEDNLDQNF